MRDVLRRVPSWLLLVAFAATVGAACDDTMSGTPLPTLPEEDPGSEDAPPAEDEPSPEPMPEPEPGPEPVPDPEPVPEPEPDLGDADDRVVPEEDDRARLPAPPDATTPHIEEVFLGQTHLLQPDDPYFGLVANRPALLEVHVVGDQERDRVRRVRAVLRLGDQRLAIRLHGPGVVPAPVERPEGPFDHRPDDAYTNVIPAAWVAPGLEIALRVEAVLPEEGDERPLYDWKLVTPRIGAPNPLHIDMFDVHFFELHDLDYNPAELSELAEKMPVSRLDIQRVRAVFETLVMPPRGNGVRAWRAASKAQYEIQAGVAFDGEQAAALQWVKALTRAGGRGRHRVTWVTIIGVLAGGQAPHDYYGVSAHRVSVLQHELGHALGLPHAGSDRNFPYRGPMFGIPVLNENDTHVGPAWGIDLRADNGFGGRYYIPPTVQPETVAEQDRVGAWKRSPMQRSGVTQDYERGFGLQMFSDYEIDRMRRELEENYLVWDAERASYFRWDSEAGAYAAPVPADGVDLPAVRDVPVVSLMASTSGSTPGISFVYPTIGPYQGGLPRSIDLSRPHDRAAVDARCARDGCDFAMRVVQGGVEAVYLLDGRWLPDMPQDDVAGFVTTAINLPADAGEIESAELLLTLDGRLEGAMPLAAQR